MRVHVVSDVHGNAEGLARAGEGADALVVLGDLIDFVDYSDYSGGILGRLFGADNVATFAKLRSSGDRNALAAFSQSLWGSLTEPHAAVDEAIREQYAELFGALSAPTYATPGNVDSPELWREFTGETVGMLDGEVTKIGGLRFGFVGGGLRPAGAWPRANPAWRPYLRSAADFEAAVDAVGEVDVLCSHIPPDVADLTYDVVARNAECGSTALRGHIERFAPRWSLFGHVHQPLAHRMRIGMTECRNVGYFKRHETPYVLRW
ncbi:metallophosphoesterase [Haloechinothrix sp. LS1_15]|uniref:metallophosphoesterase family protein n=1 Tax=Haloechinothrix sp. LS1_15 TaxID=2652248 RepID=UPI0029474CFC|nr:metallophosphoesterase [Haloechinothrix sp. LS1_15]MDV6013452.1 metallophosphoesterase [Haloechinothrix sp. LS1_15]